MHAIPFCQCLFPYAALESLVRLETILGKLSWKVAFGCYPGLVRMLGTQPQTWIPAIWIPCPAPRPCPGWWPCAAWCSLSAGRPSAWSGTGFRQSQPVRCKGSFTLVPTIRTIQPLVLTFWRQLRGNLHLATGLSMDTLVDTELEYCPLGCNRAM